MKAAAPPDQVPYVSALQVTPITLPPPISAVMQLGSPSTENPVVKNVSEHIVPIIFQIFFASVQNHPASFSQTRQQLLR